MRLGGGLSPTAEKARGAIERQVAQLVRLVDDLLDVSRISRGKIELRRERVDLRDVARAAVETSQPLLSGCRHALSEELPGEPVWVHGDPFRLTQVVGNLLNNAAKYTPPGGRVWLSVERNGESAVVRVVDTGVGLRAEDLPRVFELFTQIGGQEGRLGQGGLGIGLALVKRLSEMHGGRDEARSDGPGKGCEFAVRLPLTAS
jgi:signal transduction histidine kinase